jgi:gamma-glutamyltranspeptidase/glutathione hydrolase
MIHTQTALGGMVVAPHHLAAQAGRDVLRDGGTAVEAMVAAAATIAVVYPHMNAIGGDGFWLIHDPDRGDAPPLAIDACGAAAAAADIGWYARQGHVQAIPSRGPLAALTVAGTVGGWAQALASTAQWQAPLPLARLLADAIRHAEQGCTVSASQHALNHQKRDELQQQPGFADTYMPGGAVPAVGSLLRQPALATTLHTLAQDGLDSFYRGALATRIAQGLASLGSPLAAADLAGYRAQLVTPLRVQLQEAEVFNLPPPTQGLAALLILGLFDRLGVQEAEGFAHLHGLVEATKQAFLVRDAVVTDRGRLPADPQGFLAPAALDARARAIDMQRALPWPQPAAPGDTIWMGAIDARGRAVSFIQSVYWEWGSGVVLPGTGICWQNRGISFALDPQALNHLQPGRKPFHTLNPSLARFADGRVMPYGTMGGEGQPQTQAAVYTRHARFGQSLQQAVSAPRWLLGRTWGDVSTSLKLESRIDAAVVARLRAAGHVVEVLPEAFSDTMGHAGALVRHADGRIEGAADPRSDGAAAGW